MRPLPGRILLKAANLINNASNATLGSLHNCVLPVMLKHFCPWMQGCSRSISRRAWTWRAARVAPPPAVTPHIPICTRYIYADTYRERLCR